MKLKKTRKSKRNLCFMIGFYKISSALKNNNSTLFEKLKLTTFQTL